MVRPASGRPKSIRTTDNITVVQLDLQSRRRGPRLSSMWRPIVVHFYYVKFARGMCYKLPLMYAKKYQIWLRCFKDKGINVRWHRFFGPRCICTSINAIFNGLRCYSFSLFLTDLKAWRHMCRLAHVHLCLMYLLPTQMLFGREILF